MKKYFLILMLMCSLVFFSNDVLAFGKKSKKNIPAPITSEQPANKTVVDVKVDTPKEVRVVVPKEDINIEIPNQDEKTAKVIKEKVKNEKTTKNKVKKEKITKEKAQKEKVVKEKTKKEKVKKEKQPKEIIKEKIEKKEIVNDVISTEEVSNFFKNYIILQNKHNISALKKLYADDFISTDGYDKNQYFTLMEKTFAGFPNIKTEWNILEISANEKYAMAYVKQNAIATTKTPSQITNDNGEYSAVIQNIFYLKKVGKEWKIYSESIVYEASTIAYGMAKEAQAFIEAPQKVFADSDYSAKIRVSLPDKYSAIASINTNELVEDHNMQGEKFRQIPMDTCSLERVLHSNIKNNNEAVVVSVGFTKITEDMFKKPKVDLSGLMILMRRVDIIPANENLKVRQDKNDAKK